MKERRCEYCGKPIAKGRRPNSKYCGEFEDGSCFKQRKAEKNRKAHEKKKRKEASEQKLADKRDKRIKEEIKTTKIKWTWDLVPEKITRSQMDPMSWGE